MRCLACSAFLGATLIFVMPTFGHAWSKSVIDSGSGPDSDIAFDGSTSRRGVSYKGPIGELRFAESTDGIIWTTYATGTGVGDRNSIAFSPTTHQPGIAFNVGGHALQYIEFNGSVWSGVENVCTESECGQYPSLAYDPVSSQATLSRFASVPGDLYFCSRVSPGSWTCDIVDSADRTGGYDSLVYNPQTQRPAIAYQNTTLEDALFAYFDGSTWQIEPIDEGDNPDVGFDNNSLAFNPLNNEPCVAYLDGTNTVRLACRSGGSWSVSEIGSKGNARFPCLAFDVDGVATVAYIDTTNAYLWAARAEGSSWRHERVDNGVGALSLSCAINPITNEPCLAYSRQNGDLVHAERLEDIPAVSSWGLLALTLLLACAGTIAVARRLQTST